MNARVLREVNEAMLEERGEVEFDTYADAVAFGRKLERRGFDVHVNIPLPSIRLKARVEMCQGAHCHCRY
jgi:hypothetical protein